MGTLASVSDIASKARPGAQPERSKKTLNMARVSSLPGLKNSRGVLGPIEVNEEQFI